MYLAIQKYLFICLFLVFQWEQKHGKCFTGTFLTEMSCDRLISCYCFSCRKNFLASLCVVWNLKLGDINYQDENIWGQYQNATPRCRIVILYRANKFLKTGWEQGLGNPVNCPRHAMSLTIQTGIEIVYFSSIWFSFCLAKPCFM